MTEPKINRALLEGAGNDMGQAMFKAYLILVETLHRQGVLDAREIASALEAAVATVEATRDVKQPLHSAIAAGVREVADTLAECAPFHPQR